MNLKYFSPLIRNTNVVSLMSSSQKTTVFSFLYSSITYGLREQMPYDKSSIRGAEVNQNLDNTSDVGSTCLLKNTKNQKLS